MNGRKEHEDKTKEKIKNKLLNYPEYMTDYYYYLGRKSYTTKDVYLNRILEFLYFAKNNLNIDVKNVDCFKNITSTDINIYIEKLEGVEESTKAGKMYAIKSFFIFLLKKHYIKLNPFDEIEMPRDNKEHEIIALNKSEIEKLKNNIINGCGSELAKKRQKKWVKRDYAIVMLSLSLGLRESSVTEIDIDDIDFSKNKLTIIQKGNKMKSWYFSDEIANVLLDWIDDRRNILDDNINIKALFISKNKKRISQRAIADLITKYTYNIDKHITPHKLRSTCATNVYNKTGDIYLTADILGHSNIENTRRYAQISEERKKKAAQAMDDILF